MRLFCWPRPKSRCDTLICSCASAYQITANGRPFLILIMVALLSGCVSSQPYRLKGFDRNAYDRAYPGQKSFHEEVPVNPDHTYRLSFVELDEKGDFWDRRQLGLTAATIKNSQKPVLLVIFIRFHSPPKRIRPRVAGFRAEPSCQICLRDVLTVGTRNIMTSVQG